MGKFIIKKTATGYGFTLKAANGETIAASEVYETEAACRRGIASVEKISANARLEDTTEPSGTVTNPKFQIYTDRAGQFRFRLRSRNGQIVAVSAGYHSKTACLAGVESVRLNAPRQRSRLGINTEKEPADRRRGALAKPTRQTPIGMRGMCQFAQTGSKKILVLCKTDTLQGQSVVV